MADCELVKMDGFAPALRLKGTVKTEARIELREIKDLRRAWKNTGRSGGFSDTLGWWLKVAY